jgi:hypothetical protein
MSSPGTRKAILQAIAARELALYGPAAPTTPTTGKWFRTVRRGPVQPLAAGWPILNIQDGGQARQEGNTEGFDSSYQRELKVLLVLQLAEVWTRVDPVDDWSDRVDSLIDSLNAWALPGAGVVRIAYQNDDPADVVFLDGKSAAIWQIEFNIQYIAD